MKVELRAVILSFHAQATAFKLAQVGAPGSLSLLLLPMENACYRILRHYYDRKGMNEKVSLLTEDRRLTGLLLGLELFLDAMAQELREFIPVALLVT